jgi:hypothetical protein
MAFQKNILTQILQEVNRYEFKNEVSKYKGDYKTHKVSCFSLLVIMIYAQLKNKKTLRDVVCSLKTLAAGFFHLNIKSIARSSISDALGSRPAAVFESYYYQILKRLNRQERRKLKNKLYLIDSTTISMCIEKFKWAKYKTTKAGIKLHVQYDAEYEVPQKVIISNAQVHDIKGVRKKLSFEKGVVYVYDRGYACYKYLYEIQKKYAYFVTRMKSNWNFTITEDKQVTPNSNVLYDRIIEVIGTKAEDYPEPLRLIGFYHEESKKQLYFLTNNFDLPAEEIADIYKARWQIELFFKWAKQHLNIKAFYSTSSNGVKIQIWSALITYLLLQLIKTRLTIELDLYEILRRIQDSLDKRMGLFELITQRYSPPPAENSGQLELNYA